MDTKPCRQCGNEFKKSPAVGRAAWEKRMYCSHRCHGDAMRANPKPRQTKPCEACGNDFPRHPKDGARTWAGRRYCSRACAYSQRAGAKHHNFKDGGRFKRTADGYIGRRLFPDSPFFAMAGSQGRVLEHRLVMAEHLGRALHPDETIHHKNGDRADNRIENLELRVGRHGKGADKPHCRTCTCFD